MAENRFLLIPIDESTHSEEAFDWYMANIHRENDKVIIAHCHELYHPNMPHAEDLDEWRNILRSQEERIKALEQKFKEKAEAAKISAKILVTGGKPGEAICNLVAEHNVHMIVMGSRGQGLIRRTILGSVSDFVLHHANVPVIIVPKK